MSDWLTSGTWQAKQYDLALETYQRSISIDPTAAQLHGRVDVWSNYCSFLDVSSKSFLFLFFLDIFIDHTTGASRCQQLDTKDHDALPLYHAGQILFFKGQHDQAARYLEKAEATVQNDFLKQGFNRSSNSMHFVAIFDILL